MLLEVDAVDVGYGAGTVLDAASLRVDAGEHVGLLGRNGMGKTTLVHTIAGFLRPRRGEVRVDGRDVSRRPPERIADAGVTLVPQGHRVFRSLTVGETLEIARRHRGPEPWTVEEVCARFPVLAERWTQRAGGLSGGEQQALAIARALLGNGRLCLMDEPGEGLDPARVAVLTDVLGELRRRGTAVLLVEQKVDLALAVVDRVVVMTRGHITAREDAATLRADPSRVAAAMGLGQQPD